MIKLFKRWWAYLTASLTRRFNESTDPRVELEQAIEESQQQHRQLKEQAANVIANQKQTEMRLSRTLQELEKVNGRAQQAVRMADEASRNGDEEKALEFANAAESFANRLIGVEHEVEELKALHLQATQAADEAKQAVRDNATALQRKLAERQKLVSQLDQTKMAEQLNAARTSLSESVGADVPSLDEVRTKIEARYAKARGIAELESESVEGRMLDVDRAQMATEAQARLSQIRTQLGLSPGDTADTGGADAAAIEGGDGEQAGS